MELKDLFSDELAEIYDAEKQLTKGDSQTRGGSGFTRPSAGVF